MGNLDLRITVGGKMIYTQDMSENDDRSPLLLKVALRQVMRRLRNEEESFSQYEALAGNLGWEELADALAGAREALSRALERTEDAVEEAVKVQAESAHAHSHEHSHAHPHTHEHTHEHPHDHDHEHH